MKKSLASKSQSKVSIQSSKDYESFKRGAEIFQKFNNRQTRSKAIERFRTLRPSQMTSDIKDLELWSKDKNGANVDQQKMCQSIVWCMKRMKQNVGIFTHIKDLILIPWERKGAKKKIEDIKKERESSVYCRLLEQQPEMNDEFKGKQKY